MHQAELVSHILRQFQSGNGWCYRVLGIGLNPKQWEIKKPYFRLMKLLHPDKIPLDFYYKPRVEKAFHVLKEAYGTLTNRPVAKDSDDPIVSPKPTENKGKARSQGASQEAGEPTSPLASSEQEAR